MTKILVTGGAGFIGSHTCIELLNNGNEVVVVDNLYNASKKSLEVVERVTGKKVTFYEVDIRDEEKLNEVFEKEQNIFGVIYNFLFSIHHYYRGSHGRKLALFSIVILYIFPEKD